MKEAKIARVIRIGAATADKLNAQLAQINSKDYGRKVVADDLIGLLLGELTEKHVRALQEATLSNADRLDRDYRAYIAEHGHVSKDEYLGIRLTPESKSHKMS